MSIADRYTPVLHQRVTLYSNSTSFLSESLYYFPTYLRLHIAFIFHSGHMLLKHGNLYRTETTREMSVQISMCLVALVLGPPKHTYEVIQVTVHDEM